MSSSAATIQPEFPRSGERHARALAIVVVAALTVFVIAFALDWRLPGLYMDAVNPEYFLPGILDPSAPGNRPWILPGNLLASRFPIFTGSIYHGSTQLYFALPFVALLGVDLATFRLVQGLVGCLILALMALYAGRSIAGPKGALAASPMVLLALDPSFVMALRTQAYSCLFPLLLLLASVLLLRDWRDRPWRGLRLVLSGALFGLSVFSYFIFAFFLPALAWMLFRRSGAASVGRRVLAAALWASGCIVGYLPFAAGMFLIQHRVGGFKALVHWLRNHGDHLQMMGANISVLDRIVAVLADARSVVTGKWPWLMILQHHSGDFIGSLKAGVLIALPLLVLFFARRAQAGDSHPLRAPLLFVCSFLACASVFGERLDGHHYTTILPFLYAAFGGACALLWPFERRNALMQSSRRDLGAASIVVLALLGVASMNLLNFLHFHRDLEASGGAGLYSDAIDRFSLDVLANEPHATVYLPDWGYVMPFMFLTRASVAQLDSVDPRRIQREVCEGKPQIVVFHGNANVPKFDLVAQLAQQPKPDVAVWAQRDGVPVFQAARFAPRTDCAAGKTTASAGADVVDDAPSIAVDPASSSTCPFLSPITATVRWNANIPSLRRAEVWIAQGGGKLQPWAGGEERDEARTGPWAAPGMQFVLVDPVTKEHLASTEIGSVACPLQ
jgi:hypothetical protein